MNAVVDAVRELQEAGEDAKVLAGGQSLLPVLRMRLAAPTKLIDLGRIAELRGVREEGDALTIGAMTTHYDVQRDHLVGEHAQLLAMATSTVADPQVRIAPVVAVLAAILVLIAVVRASRKR